jgi:hypothetical protein
VSIDANRIQRLHVPPTTNIRKYPLREIFNNVVWVGTGIDDVLWRVGRTDRKGLGTCGTSCFQAGGCVLNDKA